MGLKMFPHFLEALWQSSEEEHCLSDLISLSVPSSALHLCQEEGTQIEGGSGFYPALKLLQDANQARAQLECELVQEIQELAQRYNDRWIKLARRHDMWQAQMVKQADATFQEVFSWASLADSIKLLSWCKSSAVPLHYMSRPLATAMQQDKGIPVTPTASEPEDSPAPDPSSSPACPPGTLPLPVPPLPDIPFLGSPQWGAHLLSSLPSPHRKCRTTLPVAHLVIIVTRGPMSTPKRLRLGVNTALHRVMRTHPN